MNNIYCNFYKTCCGFYTADKNCRQREGGECKLYGDYVAKIDKRLILKKYEEEEIQRELAEGDIYLVDILNSCWLLDLLD